MKHIILEASIKSDRNNNQKQFNIVNYVNL